MKKLIVSCSVVCFFLAGGLSVSAMEKVESRQTLTPNEIITRNWDCLTKAQKNWYISHPEPSKLFPFGIDVVTKTPKGYPTCLPSLTPAAYVPTVEIKDPLCLPLT